MQVKSILKAKGTRVITVAPHTTIDALAHRLRLENIGAVVVSSDGVTVDGIISERDVLRGLAEHGTELLVMPVEALMTQKRIRHLPVVNGDRLVGIVSIGDVVKNRLDDMEMEANVLRDYAIARG